MAKAQAVTVTAPKFEIVEFKIRGTTPFVQNRWSKKKLEEMHQKHEAGSTAGKNRKKEARDFEAEFEAAQYKTEDGKNGINAAAFRNASVSACKIVGFAMTRAKLSLFVEADGFDPRDGTPLVVFTKGKPQYLESPTTTSTGVANLAARPMWMPGWEAVVRMRYDADQFTLEDVTNLMVRVGAQVGVGEGRADSKKSNGMGWGFFEIVR